MALSLDTTVGGASANSYVTLQEAEAYFDFRLGADAWRGLEEQDDKVRALVMAARRLNRENWMGERATTTQALAWPRVGVVKPDSAGGYSSYSPFWAYGELFDSTTIPQVVKDAQCELALALLDGTGLNGDEDEIDAFSADGLNVQFRSARPAGSLPAAVAELLSGLIQGSRLIRA